LEVDRQEVLTVLLVEECEILGDVEEAEANPSDGSLCPSLGMNFNSPFSLLYLDDVQTFKHNIFLILN
jgi:hypothetical protein